MCSGALFFVDKQSAVADIITHKGLQQIVAVNAANQRTGVRLSSDISRVLRKIIAVQLVDGVIALLLQCTVNKLHNLLDLQGKSNLLRLQLLQLGIDLHQ